MQVVTNWDYSAIRRFFMIPGKAVSGGASGGAAGGAEGGAAVDGAPGGRRHGLESVIGNNDRAHQWRHLFDMVLALEKLIHPCHKGQSTGDTAEKPEHKWQAATIAHSVLLAWSELQPWKKCNNYMLSLMQMFWFQPDAKKLRMHRLGAARFYPTSCNPLLRESLRKLLDDVIELQHQ